MLQLKLHPVAWIASSRKLETFFPGYMFFFLCMIFKGQFPRIKSPETTHSKKIIKSCLVYERTSISNNAPCNGLLHSKNISLKLVTVSSDPRIKIVTSHYM